MRVAVLVVPYDSGHRGARMGAGPERLLGLGLVERLRTDGHDVEVHTVTHSSEPPAEIRTAFELMRGVAEGVRSATVRGRFPVVLSGNCNASVGTAAGVGPDAGVIWLDAHGDFLTPEETTGGFFDGMGLAVLTGRCWRPLAATVPGHAPTPGSHVVLVGARDLDPPERSALEVAGVPLVPPVATRDGGLLLALDALAGRVRRVLLHLDLDVLDPAHGRANTYAAPGGLSPEEVGGVIAEVGRRFLLCAVTLASYDPSTDETGAVGEAALAFVSAAVASAGENVSA